MAIKSGAASEIGPAIKVLRVARGWSQGTVELKSDRALLRCYQSRIECGRTVPSIGTIQKYADLFGITVAEIFGAVPNLLTSDISQDDVTFIKKIAAYARQMSAPSKALLVAAAKKLAVILFVLVLASPAFAQYVAPYVAVQGTLAGSNGIPAQNYTLTFNPTQLFFVGGTATIVTGSSCATDNNGNVVGLRNPLQAATFSSTTGSLPNGTYYIALSWYDSYAHQTLIGPTGTQFVSTSGQAIVISPPAAPQGAIGMNVYAGTTQTGLTYQGQTTSPTSSFTLSTYATTGNTVPTANLTTCQLIANDVGWPTGTGYNMTVIDANGNSQPGYPVQVQFLGPGSAYNISNGIPYYNGRVTYPVPVLTIPYNHNLQSISSPLSLTGYNIVNVGQLGVNTQLPTWGVDVEGTGLTSRINAAGGYLANGSGGTSGTCLGSNGTSFNTAIQCLTTANIFYQTVAVIGTATTQRPTLNFSSLFSATDSTSPAETTVGLNATGTESQVVTANTAGTSGHCVKWIGTGGVGDAGNPCPNLSSTFFAQQMTITSGICTTGTSAGATCTNSAASWPTAFHDSTYGVSCSLAQPTPGLQINYYVASQTASTVTLVLQNGQNAAAQASTVASIECIGIHN